jgi:hypothetical protein
MSACQLGWHVTSTAGILLRQGQIILERYINLFVTALRLRQVGGCYICFRSGMQ